MDSFHHITVFEDNLSNFSNIKKTPCLFLDRDGVLIKECHYLSNPNDVKLEMGGLELIRKAFFFQWKVVIITNQSGIERGLFTWKDYEKVTSRMKALIGYPMPLTAIYANGYARNSTKNTWRKPNPLMLLEASKNLGIDLSRSYLIGDRLTDLIAGARAGVKSVFHVMTGHGANERNSVVSRISSNGLFNGETYQPSVFLLESLNDFDYTNLIN